MASFQTKAWNADQCSLKVFNRVPNSYPLHSDIIFFFVQFLKFLTVIFFLVLKRGFALFFSHLVFTKITFLNFCSLFLSFTFHNNSWLLDFLLCFFSVSTTINSLFWLFPSNAYHSSLIISSLVDSHLPFCQFGLESFRRFSSTSRSIL